MFQPYFEDKENGGLFHAVSEDWSRVVDEEKISSDQFNAARIHVIGAMITHDPETIVDAGKAVDQVIARFEDKRNGGYFFAADKNWNITRRGWRRMPLWPGDLPACWRRPRRSRRAGGSRAW